MAPKAQLAKEAKDRLSDVGGLEFESQTGRVTGKSPPSLWRDGQHPAIKGPWPPERHAGQFHPDQTNNKKSNM